MQRETVESFPRGRHLSEVSSGYRRGCRGLARASTNKPKSESGKVYLVQCRYKPLKGTEGGVEWSVDCIPVLILCIPPPSTTCPWSEKPTARGRALNGDPTPEEKTKQKCARERMFTPASCASSASVGGGADGLASALEQPVLFPEPGLTGLWQSSMGKRGKDSWRGLG